MQHKHNRMSWSENARSWALSRTFSLANSCSVAATDTPDTPVRFSKLDMSRPERRDGNGR